MSYESPDVRKFLKIAGGGKCKVGKLDSNVVNTHIVYNSFFKLLFLLVYINQTYLFPTQFFCGKPAARMSQLQFVWIPNQVRNDMTAKESVSKKLRHAEFISASILHFVCRTSKQVRNDILGALLSITKSNQKTMREKRSTDDFQLLDSSISILCR